MPYHTIKFEQTGSLAVGNRLLDPSLRTVQSDPGRSNAITSGHRACQGCGEALGARYVLDTAMRATSDRVIATNATGCLEVFTTPSPESSWQLPWIHSLFGNAPAVATAAAGWCAARRCYGVCPDNAVIKLAPGGAYAYAIDLDYCKGCGLCAAECPCGAIEMRPEEG